MPTLTPMQVQRAEQATIAVVAPEALQTLERAFASASAAKASNLTAGAVDAANGLQSAANTPSYLLGATMFPAMGAGIAALAVEKPLELLGSAVGTVGSWTGSEKLQGAANNIVGFGKGVSAPIHVTGAALHSPYQVAMATPVSKGNHVISGMLGHVGTELEKHYPTIENAEKIGLGVKAKNGLNASAAKLAEIESNVGEKIGGAVKGIFGEEKAGKIGEWAKNETVYGAALKISAAGAVTAQTANTAHGFMQSYDKLEDFYRSVKGLDVDAKVSPKDVLMDSDVPQIYSDARGDILSKAPAAALLSVANAVVSWKAACMQNAQGMQGMMAIMAIGGLAHLALGATMPKSPILDLHDVATQTYAQQGQLPSKLIADYITTAIPDFRGKINAIKVEVIADHYEKLGLSPKKLLEEITSGQIAATAYLILDARNEKMAANDLTDYDTNRQTQRISKDSAIEVPTDNIYSFSMMKNAGDDLSALTAGVKEFLRESQPSLNDGGKNHAQLDAIAGYVSQKIIAEQIPPHVVVGNSSADYVIEAMEHIKAKSMASKIVPFTEVNEGKLQGMAVAPTSAKIGVSA